MAEKIKLRAKRLAVKKGKNSYQMEEVHITRSEKETFLLASKLAKKFQGKEVVLLRGELGAGKTVFAKGIAFGLGLKDIHQVCSPTFTLINIYKAKYPIFHVDLYRLEKEEEVRDLGWEDYLGEGVVVVEWAEKIKFPLKGIRVLLKIDNGERRIIKIKHD